MIGRKIIFGWAVLVLVGCQSAPPSPFTDDTLTQGDILVLADEDFRIILEAQRTVFEHIYPNAHIRIRFLPESELLKQVVNDSVRVVFATCKPGGEQSAYYRTRNLSVSMVPILTDGIAVFTAPGAGCVGRSTQELKARLSAQEGSPVLFDGTGTGVVRMLVDSLFAGDASAMRRAAALEGTDSLLTAVAQNPVAMGMISFARLSDLDDPACRAIRERLSLCALSGPNSVGPQLPNQGTLADKTYPLRRTLYAWAMEGKSGLGTGFVSFVAGHKGQRIILKSGLAPQIVPARDVMIVHP